VAVAEEVQRPRSTAAKSKSSKDLTNTKSDSATAAKVVHHKVKPGETLTSIASTYNTTVAALRRENSGVSILHPGDVLVIHAR